MTSNLEGSYHNGATITIDSVAGFENGQTINQARLKFDVPSVGAAPGPYLYLSKRPYSETKRGSLDPEFDVFIPIDNGTDEQFNVEGKYDQLLDEIDVSSQDLNEYVNGSWIVWCRPFEVWIGGGPISASR